MGCGCIGADTVGAVLGTTGAVGADVVTGADQVFAWPSSEIAVMGAEGAARIIFRKNTPEEQAKLTEEYKQNFASPYQAAELGYVDEVIDPKYTRPSIINALKMLASKHQVHPSKKHGSMPL